MFLEEVVERPGELLQAEWGAWVFRGETVCSKG
jgi:hypothetical protein